ncbi:hypothetical protein LCGC14_3136300, partial [marine sediment metagenome]
DPTVAYRRSFIVGGGAGFLNWIPFAKPISKFLPKNAAGTAMNVIINGLTEAGTEIAEGPLTPLAEAIIKHKDDDSRVDLRKLFEDMAGALKEESAIGLPSFIAGMFGVSATPSSAARAIEGKQAADNRLESIITLAEEVESLATPSEDIPSKSANNPIAPTNKEINNEIDNAAKSLRSVPGYEKYDRIQVLLNNVFNRLGTTSASEPALIDASIDLPNAVEKNRGEVNWGNMLGDKAVEAIREVGIDEEAMSVIDQWLDHPERYQGAFDALTDEEKVLGAKLKDTFDTLWIIANEADILNAWIENYTPHLYKGSKDRTNRILGGGTSGGLSKNFNRAK